MEIKKRKNMTAVKKYLRLHTTLLQKIVDCYMKLINFNISFETEF